MEVKITNYGGIIVSIKVPDKAGNIGDVVLGFDNLENYIKESPYFGAIIGRYGNRIARGKFELNGKEYQLAINNGVNHLHGGIKGFDKVLWTAEEVRSDEEVGLRLSYLSPDMEEGYPGNLKVTVEYTLDNENNLEVNYSATTDKPTIVNLTNHSYFNLTADPNNNILGQMLYINADFFLPVDSTLIPTGNKKPVAGSPFDFTESQQIGTRINDENQQLKYAGGYDHCWVLNKNDHELSLAARVIDPESGRTLEVYTTEPGIQFYTGNFLDGSLTGKNGIPYRHRSALCLESEHFPNSPNEPDFPSVVLNPGSEYHSKTVYSFSVETP